jgi:hypothetical protein
MPCHENLIQVKTALAEKYERLARLAGSTPKRRAHSFRALRLRRQAQQLAHAQGK